MYKRRWILYLLLLTLLGLGGCFGLRPYIESRMFMPPPATYTWQTPNVLNIGTEASPIAALWLPVTNAPHVILYCPGNAEDLFTSSFYFDELNTAGVSVLCIAYPGYGLSVGDATEQGCYDAADAAYRYLTETQKFTPSQISVLGYSIGTGPACYLAEKYPVGHLILEAAYKSAPRIVTGVRLLPIDPFPNITRMPNITCPKLFIHGTEDPVVPFSHGQALYEIATEPKKSVWVDGADHFTFIKKLTLPRYRQTILEFINMPQNQFEIRTGSRKNQFEIRTGLTNETKHATL